jgi:hypothetical protein
MNEKGSASSTLSPRQTLHNMDSDSICNYSRKLRRILSALSVYRGCDTAIKFIEALKLSGLSNARLVYYADRLKRILTYFTDNNIELAKAPKEDCKKCLLYLLKDSYSGNTKMAYAQCLKRLVHFEDWRDSKEGSR